MDRSGCGWADWTKNVPEASYRTELLQLGGVHERQASRIPHIAIPGKSCDDIPMSRPTSRLRYFLGDWLIFPEESLKPAVRGTASSISWKDQRDKCRAIKGFVLHVDASRHHDGPTQWRESGRVNRRSGSAPIPSVPRRSKSDMPYRLASAIRRAETMMRLRRCGKRGSRVRRGYPD